MRILVAPDKFKGSLRAREAAQHIASGLREALPDAQIVNLAVADGGEGTAEVICAAAGGEWRECNVHDPLGAIVTARYCAIENGATAVMEMSEAAGLWRVPEQLRNPETASSFGVGEMLLDAARRGAQQIIIGLGGSATNDGGFGMARALGFRFFDAAGAEIGETVGKLLRLDRILRPAALRLPPISAAADVNNPLLGHRGATRVFGPQKGAAPQQIELLEEALARLGDVVARDVGRELRELAGSGAAGGLGFGLVAFCGASIHSGFDVVAKHIGLEAAVQESDIVITGEGYLDAQTLHGKAPAGVARLARKFGKRVFAVVGHFDGAPGVQELFNGIVMAKPLAMSAAEAMKDAPKLLRSAATRLAAHIV
ncbi:MAG TPA: glycerate kinase [Chthoniobacterales bacterium]|nr:glycerate kinase [Chthoniobacterales bacterium]